MTSRAPGQADTPATLLSEAQLAAASDAELAHTVAAILYEQHQRAITAGDIDAVLEQAFIDGFDRKGDAIAPWVDGGLLFCPGMRRDKSATSHECTFVSVDDRWVWDHGNVLRDDMRHVPGPKTFKQSITIVPALEGSKIDMVNSTSRSGSDCQMRKARSFQLQGGILVEVAARSRPGQGHR
jgi:hypothetical protein